MYRSGLECRARLHAQSSGQVRGRARDAGKTRIRGRPDRRRRPGHRRTTNADRPGLLGGRYKRLAKLKTGSEEEQRQALDKAIGYYEQGMELDLNAYYCLSNLPRLYRKRAEPLDEERAQTVLRLVITACERAIKLNVADEWVRPTLLGAAFDLGTPEKAEELAKAVIAEGPPKWKVDTVLGDLEESVRQVRDAATRAAALRRHRADQGRLMAARNAAPRCSRASL
jgi:tetratricopeptide (TPR) repeat protein